jgi:hypothetical protein
LAILSTTAVAERANPSFAQSKDSNQACEGWEAKPSLRQFKSARPDHSFLRTISVRFGNSFNNCRRRARQPGLCAIEGLESGLRGVGGEAEPSAVQICPSRPFISQDNSARIADSLESAKP